MRAIFVTAIMLSTTMCTNVSNRNNEAESANHTFEGNYDWEQHMVIETFIRYWEYSGNQLALAEAIKLADWYISHSTPGHWDYGNMPYSTLEEKSLVDLETEVVLCRHVVRESG